jgi:beta-N-acetylhexosaminidase
MIPTTFRYLYTLLFFSLFTQISLKAQDPAESAWVDSVFTSLTLEQKIAQLLVIRAYSDRDSVYNDSLTRLIRKWNVGGVCFFKGTPSRQISLTNRWQKNAVTPLLIMTDAEWGAGMRLDSAFVFPRQMTLGALHNDTLIYQMAGAIARDCKRIGVHVNLAPVVDINNNPLNPVINFRSFGEERATVARKGVQYMKGLQDNGVLSTAKHFPGHGDTDSDSHFTLPIINKSKEKIDSLELYPFKELILNGAGGIMVGHLYLPAFDSGMNTPTTLSTNIITGLLREQMHFQGFIITDALDMQGVTKFFKPGEIELKALQAGNDILLLPLNPGAAVAKIKLAIDSSIVPMQTIDEKCKKILALKYRSGLKKIKTISQENLYADLHPLSSELLKRRLYKESITLIKNKNNILPLRFLDRKRILSITIGDTVDSEWEQTLRKYDNIKTLCLPASFPKIVMDSICQLLSGYDLYIIGIRCASSMPGKNYGITADLNTLIDSCVRKGNVILAILGSPYAIKPIRGSVSADAILIAYEDTPETRAYSAEILFGGLPARGILPVSASEDFPVNTIMKTEQNRFEYISPEEMGVSSAALSRIDSIVENGILQKAYPGCQVLFAKDQRVFYSKSFGSPVYEDSVAVTNDNIYDLASVTKVASTTLALMKLYDEGKIHLDDPLGKYLPKVKGSNKEGLTLRNILTHRAGLQSWIKFYEKSMTAGRADPSFYRDSATGKFNLRVAEQLYIDNAYSDTIFQSILQSPVKPGNEYLYSDLGFYLLRTVVELASGKKIETLVAENFYRPLGLTTMGYSPRNHLPLDQIIPTEKDTYFRMQLVHGDVHDPGAAMLGGISGHAGLFSNANDLAILLQILLNGGEYGGKQYLLPSTVKEFTRVQFPETGNRRGLGFDKPPLTYIPDGPVCKSASPLSFGHSGFTGTYVWADPENKLLFVFLSNRVYPNASNQKLSEMSIRTKVHQAMYDILGEVWNK